MAAFNRGIHTLSVPLELHALNRSRLVKKLQELQELKGRRAVVLLQGGESATRFCSDHEPVFRQESYFHWTFGVQEPDFFGAVDVSGNKSFLFAPQLPESYAVWMGKLHTLNSIKERYGVHEAFWTDDVSIISRILPLL